MGCCSSNASEDLTDSPTIDPLKKEDREVILEDSNMDDIEPVYTRNVPIARKAPLSEVALSAIQEVDTSPVSMTALTERVVPPSMVRSKSLNDVKKELKIDINLLKSPLTLEPKLGPKQRFFGSSPLDVSPLDLSAKSDKDIVYLHRPKKNKVTKSLESKRSVSKPILQAISNKEVDMSAVEYITDSEAENSYCDDVILQIPGFEIDC